MEYIVFIGTIALIMVIICIMGQLDNRKKKKKYLQRLKDNYGTFSEGHITPEHMKCVRTYYDRHQQSTEADLSMQIDDITWNDLEMDHLYELMNCMESSAGEEYLYYTLRTPKYEVHQLEEQETLIHFFDSHEDIRVQYQWLCRELGKTGKYSLYDYLEYLDALGKRSNLIHYVADILFIPAILSMFYSVSIGIPFVFLLICFNMVTYFKEKDQIAPYVTSFLYIMRMLQITDKISKLSAEELQPYIATLQEAKHKFRKFRNHAGLVMSDMSSTGNPLEILLDYLKMMFHIDIIKFNTMLGELQKNVDEIDQMVTTIGFMEVVIAIGNYRIALTGYCIPQFVQEHRIICDNVYHPYIKNPVKNSIDTAKCVLLTGSNASGKSTFLKTIALNAITAQTLNTVSADSYTSCFHQIYSSMSLRDSLSTGESYYMVEIRALKRILDVVQKSHYPVLCFVDEVLRGTNTVERIAASTQILKSLCNDVLCFAATHDVELTKLLEGLYENYHFTEEVIGGDVLFNYELRQGAATTRNAIQLLESIGYDKSIIAAANEQAEYFMKTGAWKVINS